MEKMPEDAINHAIECYPKESCGVIVDGEYVRCRNNAENPEDHFIMDQADYEAALGMGDIQAIVHSHPDYPAAASEADLAACEETALPWGIIELRGGSYIKHRWYQPGDWKAPLIGRQFFHGVHDCLSVILDYYDREQSINLGTFHRDDEWWNKGGDLYRENLPKAGFYLTNIDPMNIRPGELKTGDVILMQIKSPVPNHAGIYLEDGLLTSENAGHPIQGAILHHLVGKLSRRDVYGGYFQEKTVGVWRYGKQA